MEDDPVARLALWEFMARQSIIATTKPGSRAVMAVMRDGRVVSEWDAEPWLEDLRRMREMAMAKEKEAP